MDRYDFYLDKCKLPVAPGKLQIKVNNANDTVTLINEGEINLLKTPGLTDIEFECLIPQTGYPFASYPSGFQGASYYLDCFETFKVEKKPFQFIVSRAAASGQTFFSTDIKVALEDYQITEQAEEGFDLKVKVKLRQYREYGTKIAERPAAASGGAAKLKKTRAESTVQPSKPIGIGSDVIVNGQLHRDSYGAGPGQVKSNYRGKINFINTKGSHPYHVTTPSGGWLGWVGAKCVKGV